MNIDEIMSNLDSNLILTYKIDINQEKINQLIEYCIKYNLKEKAWRIALTFDQYGYDFSNLANYYIRVRDNWYLIELLYVVGEESIKLYETYNDVLKTKDLKFIEEFEKDLMSYCIISDKEELIKKINSYKK